MMPKRVCLVALSLLGLLLTGCQALSVILPQKGVAEYSLEKKHQYAVFIDDYMAPTGGLKLKKKLAEAIGEKLVEARVIEETDVVAIDRVFDQPTDSPDGKKLSIQHIGREAGADYVIYLNLIEFNLQCDSDNPLIQPKARAYVKLIEVKTGERLWPIDIAGKQIEAREKMHGVVAVDADREEWTQKLVDLLATEVSHLFYDYLIR